MLERVALGQTRFSTPGVAPDGRGILLGRFGVLLFSSLDGVVGWLRLYSHEAPLDDLLPETRILRVRTTLGSRAFLLQIPAPSSYVLDRASRCARLVGGQTFTGSSRHFVRYRDERAPYGYDVVDLAPGSESAEMVLHGIDESRVYAADGDVSLRGLIFQLSLRRVPGRRREDQDVLPEVLVTAPAGLGPGLIRYLWRSRVEAEAAMLTPAEEKSFGSTDGYLIRMREVPRRVFDNFQGIPGVTLYRAVVDNVAVEMGFEHPVELSSCSTLFDPQRHYLFKGREDRVDIVAGPVEMVSAEHLIDIAIPDGAPREAHLSAEAVPPVGVKLRLEPALAPPTRVVGTLVPWEEAGRLKKLVYALPPSLLRGHRMAAGDRGILLLATGGVDVVPLGTLLVETAPGILVPLGMDLVPRVSQDVLARSLGHGGGRITVFPHQGGPFCIKEEHAEPLERRALAHLEVAVAEPRDDLAAFAPDDPRVVNDPLGAFALWRFPSPSEK